MQVFDNRGEAGRELASTLADHPAVIGAERLVILAVPRGGLPVGAEVAQVLNAELDVVVARKLRTPHNPELGFGAVGADGHVEVDHVTVERLGITQEQLDTEIADRREAVQRRLALYRSVASPVDLRGAVVVVVDDGIATGGTARQACALARRGGAAVVILAVPVAPVDTADRLADAADDIVVLSSPAEFLGVSQTYAEFEQLDDEAAVAALRSVSRAG
jgi:putative phosphoribosyl transferase